MVCVASVGADPQRSCGENVLDIIVFHNSYIIYVCVHSLTSWVDS